MARFDIEAFLQTNYDEALDTERTLFPAGECAGNIETINIHPPKPFTDADGNERTGSPQLELKIAVREDHAERIRNLLGYAADKPVYFIHRLFLEINEENGALEFGPNKNIALGQIRSALGQNNPGEPWNFRMLQNSSMLSFIVKHEDWEKNGKKGTSERVTKWAEAA